MGLLTKILEHFREQDWIEASPLEAGLSKRNLKEAETKILAKMREVVEGINSIDYPYGADFKHAILKVLDKEREPGGNLPDSPTER